MHNHQQEITGEQMQMQEPRIRLVAFDDIEFGTEPPYLIKGLIPRVGLTVIWGPPKSGKSFWTFDAVMHIALGWEYRGRSVQPGPVVYVAAEGSTGLRARVEAFRQHRIGDAHEGKRPFYLVPVNLDLIDESAALITAIKARLGDDPPAAVAIDTLNRTLRGSESSDEDMTAYITAADAIREAFGCAVIIVHHCGVDQTRPRGHTSLAGAVDAQIAIKRNGAGDIISTVEWMKDGAEGEQTASRLEVVEVGLDDDGELITSCVIVPCDVPTSGRKPRVQGQAKVALDLLHRAIDEAGEIPPANNHIPGGQMVVPLTLWRTYCKSGGLAGGDNEEAFKKAWQRVRDKLLTRGIISIWNDVVWLCNEEGDKGT